MSRPPVSGSSDAHSHGSSEPGPDRTVELPPDEAADATFAEGTPHSTTSHVASAADVDDQTLADDQTRPANSQWGQAETVAAPQSFVTPQSHAAPSASSDPDRTVVDPGAMQSEVHTQIDQPADPDATKLAPAASAEPSQETFIETNDPQARTTAGKTGFAATVVGEWPQSHPKKSSDAPRAEDRYKLLDNFAHGGLGNIWRAEDTSIHREVAFKELLPRALKNKLVVERFLEEAQITGQLEHPGIVPIYDVGYQENGTPYYAMKLVKGTDMDKAITAMHQLPRESSERQLAFTRLLRQFVAVCQAVAFAHEKGVLHRDLKPLNVMIGEFGETLVLDWGLAKVLDVIGEQMIATDSGGKLDEMEPAMSADDMTVAEQDVSAPSPTMDAQRTTNTHAGATQSPTNSVSGSITGKTQEGTWFRRQVMTDARTAGSQTMMGQVLGTVAYMPPEQAEGLVHRLDARSDIYSLGGILYKLLTNHQPAPRGKVNEILKLVIAGQIKPPREIDGTIPKPLDAICRKAMSKHQEDRYTSALVLAADVEAWLADEPVSVFADPWVTRTRRWAKRHRTAVLSAATALLVVAIGSGTWTVLESNRIANLRLSATTKANDARRVLETNDFVKASALLAEAIGIVQSEASLDFVRQGLRDQLDDVSRLQAAAERERVATVQSKVVQRLSEVETAINDRDDFAQAKVMLIEVVTLLANEPTLAELREAARAKLSDVDAALARQSDVAAAKAQFAKFVNSVEQVRVLGSGISGEEAIDDVRRARDLAVEALAMFPIDFENPAARDPQFDRLERSAFEAWRQSVLELLIAIGQAEVQLAVKDDPDDLKPALQRGLARVRQAEQLQLDSPPLQFLKSDLLARLGQTADAESALGRARELTPRTRLDFYLLGERAQKLRKFDEALQHYQAALRVDPDDFWSLYLIGQTYQLGNQLEAAVASYTASIARRPEFVWPYLKRGVAFTQLRQFDNAVRDFERADMLQPQSYHVALNRGFLFLVQKQYDAARQDFQAAAALEPKLASPHLNLAELSRRRGLDLLSADASDGRIQAAAEFQNALVALTKAAEIVPQEARVYLERGRAHAALNSTVAALADFQRAISLTANPIARAICFREMGIIHQRANRAAEALAAFDQSLAHNPNDTAVLRQRAEALTALGRTADAIAGFSAFLEKNGPDADAYRARGLAFALLDKYGEAINDYTMSLQFEPAPNMLTRRGWAYLIQSAKLAKQDFEEALKQNPQNPDSHWGLAYALVQLGEHARAAAVIDNVSEPARRATATLGPRAWPLLFNPATVLAQAYAKVLVDPKLPADQREELAAKYSAQSVKLLGEAHRVAGPQFRETFLKALRTDSALDPIRQRAEFLSVLPTLDPAASLKDKPANGKSSTNEAPPKN